MFKQNKRGYICIIAPFNILNIKVTSLPYGGLFFVQESSLGETDNVLPIVVKKVILIKTLSDSSFLSKSIIAYSLVYVGLLLV